MSGSMMFMHTFPPTVQAAMNQREHPRPAWVAKAAGENRQDAVAPTDHGSSPAEFGSPLLIGSLSSDGAAATPEPEASALGIHRDPAGGNSGPPGAGTVADGARVLVISSGIDDADGLEAAARQGVIVVRYDVETVSLDGLLEGIRAALDGGRAHRIGFAAHNAEGGRLTLTGNTTFTAASLTEDLAHQAFWTSIAGALTEAGRIDLLGCNVGRDAAGSELVSRLEALTGVNVAASADPTGNVDQGGDWFLESDGVDARAVYFDEVRLERFESLLLGPVITPIDPLTGEDGDTGTFTVRLDTQDTVNVTVSIVNSDPSEGTISVPTGGFLFFTPTDWDIPQTVVMIGVDDTFLDGDVPYSVTAEAFGGIYSGESSQVTLTNLDNDYPDVLISTVDLVTSEDGDTGALAVSLGAEPASPVTVSIASDDTSEGIVSTGLVLTFTTANWAVFQSITVTGVDDPIVDGSVTYSVVASASGGGYDGVTAASIFTNLDNDPGIFVTPDNGLTTSEDGGTAAFAVELTSQPTGNVTVDLASDDTSEGIVSTGSTLTFTTSTWSVPQNIAVTGVDDPALDGDVPYSVTATASGANYAGLWASAGFINLDNDAPGVTVSPIDQTTSETGDTGTFSIALTAQPISDVVISVVSDDTSEGIIASPPTITFSSSNWSSPLTVTVAGKDDQVVDGDVAYTATYSAAGPGYDGLSGTVDFTNVDDDAAGISVNPVSDLATSEDGGSATFTVLLTAQPLSDVVISLSSSDTSEGTTPTGLLNFNTGNWSTPRTVTVTGADDAIADGDVNYLIALTAASTDGLFDGLTESVSLVNQDNDAAGISVNPVNGLTTSEDGGSATFTVQLTSQPTTDVTITLTSTDTGEGTLSTGTLAFGTDNWSAPRTVTVTGADDPLGDGPVGYTVVGTAVSADPSYNGLTLDPVNLTNLDNEASGWVINEVHATPDPAAGDANADGTIGLSDDEFVELVNGTSASVDISGWTLSDSADARHVFPAGTVVAPGCAVVVFGGGSPAGDFGYVTVQTASSGTLDLDDLGDTLTLTDETSAVVTSLGYGTEAGNGQSITLNPDITGTPPLVQHLSLTGAAAVRFSPGTTVEGATFAGCNTPPVADAIDAVTTDEDGPSVSIDLWNAFGDAEDDVSELAYEIMENSNPDLFQSIIVAENRYLSMDFTPDANGTADVTVRGTDTGGMSAETVVTVTVNPINDPPAPAPDQLTVIQDTPLTVESPGVLANDTDIDGDALSAVLVSSPSYGSLTLDPNGGFQYIPDAGYFGTDSFSYKASDGSLESAQVTVTLSIRQDNRSPIAAGDAYDGSVDSPLSIPAPGILSNDADPDGDTLSARLISLPSHGTLSVDPDGGFQYVPDEGFSGTDTFVYEAFDGSAASAPTTVTIRISVPDIAPVAADDGYTVAEDQTLSVPGPGVLGNDSGESLSATLEGSVSHGDLSLNPDGGFTYTPGTDYHGTDRFSYIATDGDRTSEPATVTFTVTPINDPPTITGQAPLSATVGFPLTITLGDLSVTDPDNTYPDEFQLVAGDGAGYTRAGLVITPTADAPETIAVPVRVNDGTADSPEFPLSISVSRDNQPPVADAGPDLAVRGGQSVTLDGTRSHDPDGTIAQYRWEQISGPAVDLAPSDAATAFFTAPDAPAELSFRLTVVDENGARSLDDISVEVDPAQLFPITPPRITEPDDGAIFESETVDLRVDPLPDDQIPEGLAIHWRVRRAGRGYGCPTDPPSFDHVGDDLTGYTVTGAHSGGEYIWQAGYVDPETGDTLWSEERTFTAGAVVETHTVSVPPGETIPEYRMVAFPLDPGVPAETMLDGLSGIYDISLYRIGTYDPLAGGYIEFGEELPMAPGRSIWVLARNGLDLTLSGVAASPFHDQEVELLYDPLNDSGWNMIAAPNGGNYPWGRVELLVYNDDGRCTTEVGPIPIAELSEGNPWVDKRLWRWENGEYRSDTDTLEDGIGYWVRARDERVVLRFPAEVRTEDHTGPTIVRALKRGAGWLRRLGAGNAMADDGQTPPLPPAAITTDVREKGSGECFIETGCASWRKP